ncbi:Retrovirus-related Pol polyprotein from transposon TNT 1-94, partial [Sesbania bispinosa]
MGTGAPPNEPHNNVHEIPVEGRVRRNRREPIWMTDYESGEGLSDEDGLNAMMM